MDQKTRGHIAALTANLFFGINFSAVKFITPSVIHPLALNLLRIGIAAFMFWGLLLIRPGSVKIQRRHWGRLLLCTLTGVVLNQVLFIKGLSLTWSTHGSLLMLTTPILITFIASWLLKEAVTPLKMAGLLMGILGSVILITLHEKTGSGENVWLGDLYIFLNASCYAFYLVLVRPLMEAYPPLLIMRWLFALGLIMILPPGWGHVSQVNWNAFGPAHLGSLAFVILGGTFFAYLFTIYAVRQIGPSLTGAWIYTQPVFAALVAIGWQGEEIGPLKLLAAAFIFLGVYLVSAKKNTPDK